MVGRELGDHFSDPFLCERARVAARTRAGDERDAARGHESRPLRAENVELARVEVQKLVADADPRRDQHAAALCEALLLTRVHWKRGAVERPARSDAVVRLLADETLED